MPDPQPDPHPEPHPEPQPGLAAEFGCRYTACLVIRLASVTALVLFAAACGVGGLPAKGISLPQALSGSSEWLEFESMAARQELYRDVVRVSQEQSGLAGPVLFPLARDGQLVAAPALGARQDLLQTPDGGGQWALSFDNRGDAFGEDRREAYQGLSEREATEIVARSLLQHWGVRPTGTVVVMRSAGAPYAAAYVDGVLRVNPSFVTVACAAAP
jgi:hypothetical protein